MSNLSLSRKLGRYPPPHGIFAEKEARDEIDLCESHRAWPGDQDGEGVVTTPLVTRRGRSLKGGNKPDSGRASRDLYARSAPGAGAVAPGAPLGWSPR